VNGNWQPTWIRLFQPAVSGHERHFDQDVHPSQPGKRHPVNRSLRRKMRCSTGITGSTSGERGKMIPRQLF
jgi:hypothetical protein